VGGGVRRVPVIRSSDYHDFVIKEGRFIGEFEQMYEQVADPWHCVAEVGAFKNVLLLAAVTQVRAEVRRALDVGCGLGALTARLRQAAPLAEWHACDVSRTAIDRAERDYPGIRFFVYDLGQIDRIPFERGSLDLITMAEVVWYVLPHLAAILTRFFGLLRPGGHLMLLQYFLAPEQQQYGKEIVAAPGELIRLLAEAGFQIREQAYLGAQPPQSLLLWGVKAPA